MSEHAELAHPPIVLGSSSPRRRELLARLRVPFSIVTADVDETPLADETPSALALRLALKKAYAVQRLIPTQNIPLTTENAQYSDDRLKARAEPIVIAADTVVAMGQDLLGKPRDRQDACAMIQSLVGREHMGITAIAVARGEHVEHAVHQSRVWLRLLSDHDIQSYVDSGDPMDKAGGYGIQNPAFQPVERLVGCRCSMMGLPLGALIALLERFGVHPPRTIPAACPQPESNMESCMTAAFSIT